MPSHTVRPAGKRHSHAGYVGGADTQAGQLPARDARDSGHVVPVAVPAAADARSGKSAGLFQLQELQRDARAPRGDSGGTRRHAAGRGGAPGRRWRGAFAGHRFRASGVPPEEAVRGCPGVTRAARLSAPGRCRARRQQERRDHRRPTAAACAPGRRATGTGGLRRRPDARTRRRTSAERTEAAGHQCCWPVGSRSATVRPGF
jgi:hypothetical protein